MSVLGVLYHWSPVERRVAILREGLVPYARPVCHSPLPDGQIMSMPYVCLGASPSAAWGLSGGTDPEVVDEFAGWDLWEVVLAERDSVHVLPQWGARIREVRVRNAIGADRVWWVGTRTGLSGIGEDGRPVVLDA